MARLPATFAGLPIMFRVPQVMRTVWDFTTGLNNQSFPTAPVTHAVDLPFEVHRMIPRVAAYDEDGVILGEQPPEDLMNALISVRIRDFGKNNSLTKSMTALDNLVRGSSERTWEWADPYYLKQGDGFEVTGRSATFPVLADVVTLRVNLTFEGFLVVMAPPTGAR